MKVLQINSVCGYGSTGRIAVDLYRTIIKQGYSGKIAYGRGTAPEEVDSLKIGNSMQVYLNVVKNRILDNEGFSSKFATQELIKQIEQYNPDIIHLHNIHGYYLNIEILFEYLTKSNIPVVWTLHDCWTLTGHCAYFDYVECGRWKTNCCSCPQKGEYPKSVALDKSEKNHIKKKEIFSKHKNITFVTPSEWLADVLKKSYMKEFPVEVINNGIDLEVFSPTESNLREEYNLKDKFVILGVASIWDRRKGLEYFAKLSEGLDKSFKIILIGVSEKQKRQLPNGVIGIERTNNIRELAKFYSMADVFVNPTLEDNFPTTNIEALACGTPVVTYNTGGSPEIADKTCGMVIEKKDYNKLIETIRSLRENNFSMEDCRARSQLYNRDIKYLEYIKLYEKIKKGI